jgi:hypothetical protein
MSSAPRSHAIRVLCVAWLMAGCHFVTGVEFSSVDAEGGAAAEAGGAAGATSAGATAESGTAIGGSAGNAMSGSAGDASGGSSGATMGGSGGALASACSGVAAWNERPYVMGEKTTSVCQAPYNGLCIAGVEHEFECRPPAGAVGLGWCRVREPGVVNGWQEAWVLHTRCSP